MSRRLSRKGFLGLAAAAVLGLAAAPTYSLVAGSPLLERPPGRRPARAACCYGPRALGEEQAPSAADTPLPVPEAAPAPELTAEAGPPAPSPQPSQMSAAEPAPTVQATPTPVASSVQRQPQPPAAPSPLAAPPAEAPASPAAQSPSPETQLAQRALDLFGVIVVLEGQEWGGDLNVRLANLQAAIDALARLPKHVVAALSSGHPHGPLHILYNNHGRTLAGWQPYGDFPIGFYTNSDHDPRTGQAQASNQVVLIPGFADASIGHELLHAHQFRAVPPDEYGLAMLGPEMRSFAEATGWVQVGSDQEVLAASQPSSSWADFNALFEYRGRDMAYTTANGARSVLRPVNPLEAFAVAGSFYYTRPSSIPLPDWPEYWSWFSANLGAA